MTDDVVGPDLLSEAHLAVATTFFELASSQGFVVAGGSALIARGAVARMTDDLDLFTSPDGGNVETACRDLAEAAAQRGWNVETVRAGESFARLLVTVDGGELVVDLAVDAPLLAAPTLTLLGPTITLEESAGQKMLALFGRAAPRDFVDVFALSGRFTKSVLLALAHERDPGFDTGVLREMFSQLDRFSDGRLPVDASRVAPLRGFFDQWRRELEADPSR